MAELIDKAHVRVADLPNWTEPQTVNDVITGTAWTSGWVYLDGPNPGVFASPDGRLWVHRDRVTYPMTSRPDDVADRVLIVRIPGDTGDIAVWINRRKYQHIQTRAIKSAMDSGDFSRWRSVQGIFASRPEWVG